MSYGYDNIGQLKGARGVDQYSYDTGSGTWSTPPRLQEQFGYAYDKAWNLSARTNNAMVQTFTVNNLNELSNANWSGTLTVAGSAGEPAPDAPYYSYPGETNVTVNTTNAHVYGDGSFAATNFTPVSGSNTYTAIAKDTYGRRSTNSVTATLASPTYLYDANGNLTNDGTRSFAYDDENELIAVWKASAWSNRFVYDGLLRKRIELERREIPCSDGGRPKFNHGVFAGGLSTIKHNRHCLIGTVSENVSEGSRRLRKILTV